MNAFFFIIPNMFWCPVVLYFSYKDLGKRLTNFIQEYMSLEILLSSKVNWETANNQINSYSPNIILGNQEKLYHKTKRTIILTYMYLAFPSLTFSVMMGFFFLVDEMTTIASIGHGIISFIIPCGLVFSPPVMSNSKNLLKWKHMYPHLLYYDFQSHWS